MNNETPADLMNESRKDAVQRLLKSVRGFKDEFVTRPAVSDPVKPADARRAYLTVRNNEYEIGALRSQYKIKRTIQMLKDGERKLQRREN